MKILSLFFALFSLAMPAFSLEQQGISIEASEEYKSANFRALCSPPKPEPSEECKDLKETLSSNWEKYINQVVGNNAVAQFVASKISTYFVEKFLGAFECRTQVFIVNLINTGLSYFFSGFESKAS